MTQWAIVPNELEYEINTKLDIAFAKAPRAEKDREIFYHQLLNYFDQHGFLPDFELQKTKEEA